LTATDPHSNAVHLDVFDGPLELLLFIVRRDGVDLRAVPIAPIADAFLAALELARLQMLDVTQAEHLGPIVLTSRTTPEEADMGRLSGALGAQL